MDNITISTPYDNTFTYYQNKTYMYQPDMSNGTLDDMVTAVNPVLLVSMYIVRGGTNIEFSHDFYYILEELCFGFDPVPGFSCSLCDHLKSSKNREANEHPHCSTNCPHQCHP